MQVKAWQKEVIMTLPNNCQKKEMIKISSLLFGTNMN